jgi:hypothetical protein
MTKLIPTEHSLMLSGAIVWALDDSPPTPEQEARLVEKHRKAMEWIVEQPANAKVTA